MITMAMPDTLRLAGALHPVSKGGGVLQERILLPPTLSSKASLGYIA